MKKISFIIFLIITFPGCLAGPLGCCIQIAILYNVLCIYKLIKHNFYPFS